MYSLVAVMILVMELFSTFLVRREWYTWTMYRVCVILVRF